MSLYIGIMSGTSMDGVDAVLVDLAFTPPKIIAHEHCAYPQEVYTALMQLVTKQEARLEMLGRLHTHLGEIYAHSVLELLKAAQIKASEIQAIGLHGQTIFHAPMGLHPFTWQLGNAHVVAALTGMPVIADFRGLDVALGGQGAPLAPVFHLALFGTLASKLAVLNLGGIANVTLIAQQKIIKAFDTGPANCLIDVWMQETQGQPYDQEGACARSGKVLPDLLATLLEEPYFRKQAPKSTGRELFNLAWLKSKLPSHYVEADVVATLTELTTRTIAEALAQAHFTPEVLIACGGGMYNRFLLERLASLLPCPVKTSMAYGFSPETIEPVAFAYLAKLFLDHQKLALGTITGAQVPHFCGVKYLPV